MIFSEESKEAFTIHMDKLLDSYKRIIVVNLLDAEGKEGPLGEEYANIVSRRGCSKEGPLAPRGGVC